MASVVTITAPAVLVSLANIKAHLNIGAGVTDDDAILTIYIAAACAHIDGPDGWLGRAIGMQTLEYRADTFSTDPILLPVGPVISVVSVKYIDTSGVEQTLSSTVYQLTADALLVAYQQSWPALRGDAEGVRVLFTAGYAATPPAVAAAVMLMVGDLYSRRETVADGITSAVAMSTTVESLLSPFRAWRF